MRYLSAYLLATLGGNSNPSIDDISGILSSVGIEVDKERATKVIAELKGKNVAELIAAGSTKLASVPSGGGGSGGAAAPSGDAAKGDSPAKESKKEEKKEEEEEEDDDMGFGLFD
ncbi:60S acidic ribosomal protein P2-like [Panonychus citri]|uniref:60S acidic ribosomal protein P2-like n=1 Tax=Panonychus citri TaxID=50023 RepID=UPI002306F808|nr:60S acidic ribosomal protein P2-like [Panonychus citri]XP_053205922.1 60S acidic ribosomal protein P2-like [Panonychus citri]XP_053214807.1 60S acidic ribosomal protein P2-like [Panonychus citri]